MKIEYLENYDSAMFDGLKFRRDKKTGYYLNSTLHIRLHVYVWEYHNIKVPKGYQVHHKKGKMYNDIEDLQLLTQSEHMRLHGENETEKRKQFKRNNLNEKARPKAIEWHKSKKGNEWHKKHYEQFKDKLHADVVRICEQCGKQYEGKLNSKFCSDSCKSKWRREQGLDNEIRVCIYCNKEFEVNKYSKVKTCSRSCASKINYQLRTRYTKKCDNCNKEYETTQEASRFCSNSCLQKWKRKNGEYNEKRICVYCGLEFETNKYEKTRTCSPGCSSKVAYQNRNNTMKLQ